MYSIDAQSRMRPARKVIGHVFITTEHSFDDRKDSIIRNPWIAAKVIRVKRERVLGVFLMYGDVKVEIRKPRKSGDLSEECELNWESGCVDWGGLSSFTGCRLVRTVGRQRRSCNAACFFSPLRSSPTTVPPEIDH